MFVSKYTSSQHIERERYHCRILPCAEHAVWIKSDVDQYFLLRQSYLTLRQSTTPYIRQRPHGRVRESRAIEIAHPESDHSEQ